MPAADRLLFWMLRLGGMVTLSAFFAIFLPWDWMAATHRALGMGDLPHSPIVEYLARSASAVYAMHGAVVLYSSFDIRRNAGLIRLLAAMLLLFGPVMLVIDLKAGMPWHWTASEGPFLIVYGTIILLSQRASGRRSA